MARRDTEAFADKAILEEMLCLRKQGWSYNRLGLKYDRDHTTIIYWCQKMGVVPKTEKRIIVQGFQTSLKKITTVDSIMVSPKLPLEKINSGKSYREYLEEERKRKYGKLYFLAPRIEINPETGFDLFAKNNPTIAV